PFQSHLDSLYQSGDNLDADPRSIQKIVEFLIDEGVNPQQIVIGSAFYGRVWKGVPAESNGLYQLSTGLHIGWMAYEHIRESYESVGIFQLFWDDQTLATLMYNTKDTLIVS